MYIYMRTFASFSQKTPTFIYEYEHELSYNI